MKCLRTSAVLVLFLTLAIAILRADTEQVQQKLKELVARQNEIFTDAEKKGDALDADNLQSQLQQLCHEYDALLRQNPDFAPTYVAYGLLLGKVEMRKESIAMLLKANQLDKTLPIVKNQLGNYLAEEGQPLEAVNYFTAAIQLEPKEPLYHYQLGTLLVEARDDFLKSGQWTRAVLDKNMHDAFEQAMLLAPDDWRYAYRYGLSFYDLQTGEWEEALQFWRAFEKKLNPGVEQQTCRLHQAKVLLELRRLDEAKIMLASVTEPQLSSQKEKVSQELAALAEKTDAAASDKTEK